MVGPRERKTCARCGRMFAWRRKWAGCWSQVRYCSARCRGARPGREAARIERAIAERLARTDGTICPSEVARELWPDRWRQRMEDVRSVARRVAADGGIVWLQGGRRVDPSSARGPVRLARGPRFAPLSS